MNIAYIILQILWPIKIPEFNSNETSASNYHSTDILYCRLRLLIKTIDLELNVVLNCSILLKSTENNSERIKIMWVSMALFLRSHYMISVFLLFPFNWLGNNPQSFGIIHRVFIFSIHFSSVTAGFPFMCLHS